MKNWCNLQYFRLGRKYLRLGRKFTFEAEKFTFEAEKYLKGWLLTALPFQAEIMVPEAEKHAFSTQKRPKIPFFML